MYTVRKNPSAVGKNVEKKESRSDTVVFLVAIT
jgi:hypothetical protein